jgi:hypothetical protein
MTIGSVDDCSRGGVCGRAAAQPGVIASEVEVRDKAFANVRCVARA